jgi:hypothetical protein
MKKDDANEAKKPVKTNTIKVPFLDSFFMAVSLRKAEVF